MAQTLNAWLRRLPVWAVWLLGLIPLAVLVWDMLNGGLGVDPVKSIEHRLGRTALYFLIGGLGVTPLMRFARVNMMRFRRALGLLAFGYAALHLASWVVLDMGLFWAQMLKDVIKRPYLIFGGAAFVMLLALAVTSNNASVRRLGRKWRSLHKLVYLAVPLVVVHWLWALKVWEAAPILWGVVTMILLSLRVIPRSQRRK